MRIKGDNFFDLIFLMIIEDFQIKIAQQIKVHFVAIVANTHNT